MSQKSKARNRLRQAEAEIRIRAEARAENQLEQQALRNDWIAEPAERARAMDRLMEIIDRPDSLGENDRYASIAIRTLAQVDQRRQMLEIQRERLAAARAARARTAAEITFDPSEPEPPKRINIPDVDDRLEPRED